MFSFLSIPGTVVEIWMSVRHVVCIIQLFHIGWNICDDILLLSAECLLDMVEALSF